MSTKVTITYARPGEHGEDFHLYFDYADFDVHLEVNGKEVPLPARLRSWIYNAWAVLQSLREVHIVISDPERWLHVGPLGAEVSRNLDKYDPLADLDIPEVSWE